MLFAILSAISAAAAPEVRLTNDVAGGYTSLYQLATGHSYTDFVLQECGIARGRQNEPSVAMNPRDSRVLVGSSNDYCGVYAGSPAGTFAPVGPIWLGYYRSTDGGANFTSSLVPGYPGDTSQYAPLAKIRTASSGDPVLTWDNHGRLFVGSESSEDPTGSKKGFGDVWVARFDNPLGEGGNTLRDGLQFQGTAIVARGSSSPGTGKFNDKTSIQADRSGSVCDGNVYFAWSRFTGAGVSNIYFSRSTDHAATWSSPILLTSSVGNVQDPEISVTGNGHVYVSFDQGSTNSKQVNGVGIAKSIDCGKTFAKPVVAAAYITYDAQDISAPAAPSAPTSARDDPLSAEGTRAAGSLSRDCGDFADACQSGYTFFRRSSSTRSSADQTDTLHDYIYLTFDATKPGSEVDTGTSYGSIRPGRGSQSAVYFVRFDGATGQASAPALMDNQRVGHQFFPAISADAGILHALWWDSRNDPAYSAARPIGNDDAGKVYPSLDVYASTSGDGGAHWSVPARVTANSTNGNFEQFDNRSVPFAGDYLWVTSVGAAAFGTWTDWRRTVAGTDPRQPADASGADVTQCRTFVNGAWTGDQCPHAGGIDQNIFGSVVP